MSDGSLHSATRAATSAAVRRLVTSVVLLVSVLAVGTLGFVALGDDRGGFEALYLAMIILSTVGMKEGSQTLSEPEQWWAVFLMAAGVGTMLYATGNLVAFMVDGELQRVLGRRHLLQRISQMHDHFIVCGFGRMGRALCARLREQRVPFVLIEQDRDNAEEAEKLGYVVIREDAML